MSTQLHLIQDTRLFFSRRTIKSEFDGDIYISTDFCPVRHSRQCSQILTLDMRIGIVMKGPTTFPIRYKRSPSVHNLIQIQNGTFHRQHPDTNLSSVGHETVSPLFPNLHFSLPAFPLIRDNSGKEKQQHWAVVGAAGASTFLEILQGIHICVPPNARTFPQLSLDNENLDQHRRRSPRTAIQYVGFLPGKGQGSCSGIRGSYLSERYESRKEETDWSLLQYLMGKMELNSSETNEGNPVFTSSLSQVIKDLKLEKLMDIPARDLSSGQTRRASIAKALLRKPRLLLLDKPFSRFRSSFPAGDLSF
jgi:hypothetical protein